MFYFGCIQNAKSEFRDAGHYLYKAGYSSNWNGSNIDRMIHAQLVYSMHIDGGYCPDSTSKNGSCCVVYEQGLTIVGFWDQSGDPRPKSNSNFIEFGHLSFPQMIEIAEATFPELFERFKRFKIKVTFV